MNLLSLGGLTVVFFDFLFTSLLLISIILSVLNAFNKSIGTELDWMVACMFGVVFLIYNYCLSQTVQFHWNRLIEYIYIFMTFIAYIIFFAVLFRDSLINKEHDI